MRTVLRQICNDHPDVAAEILSAAPRPSVQSTLSVLSTYETNLRQAMPFGVRETSEYAYNRVRQQLQSLLDALRDFTPQFLAPHEPQAATSLAYLDGATEMVHRLPTWESYSQNRHKAEAYEELAQAWALTVREAAKRAGGIHLQVGGWPQKLLRHNELAGGKLDEAVLVLRQSLGLQLDVPPVYGEPDFAVARTRHQPVFKVA